MGQILHGSATTTEAIRRAIQNSQESLRALAGHYGINQKTVPNGRRGRQSPMCRLVRKSQGQQFSRWKKRPSSLHSENTRCYRSMIAFTPCRPQSHICPARPCIVAYSDMVSLGCRKWMATSRIEKSSRPIRSAISTST